MSAHKALNGARAFLLKAEICIDIALKCMDGNERACKMSEVLCEP